MDIYNLIILLPLLGSAVIGLVGFNSEAFRKQEKLIGTIASLAVAIPFLLIVSVFLGYESGNPKTIEFFTWMVAGNLEVNFTYSLDELSLIMGMIVTGVGSLIHIYSIGYMHGDKGYYKFFSYLNLFIFAMLNLILGDNLIVLFLGWEGVGVCSYLLIGFWYIDMMKAKAAQKAFVANRIGDFAMIVAMMLIFSNLMRAGTGVNMSFSEVIAFANTGAGFGTDTFWIALLMFIAATGKSAQIPLFVWLPDAMAGPTPVSALIHAATMVTSGIYLIARLSPVFAQTPDVLLIIVIVAAATALLAALMALAQNDIKGVLAYSTVSQLGFMFMALGAGAYTTAIFHVMTHAFFKACLFLGSGSVIHAMEHMHTVEDPQDIRTMGGLKKYMPSTSKTFIISTLAIAGIPLFSGFFSKDEILASLFFNGEENFIYYAVWVVAVFTALLTAFYMTRLTFLTFYGKERFPQTKHPHESSSLMTIPLWILAALATVGGFLGIPYLIGHGELHWLDHHWLGHLIHNNHAIHANASVGWEAFLMGLSTVVAVGSVMFAYRFYTKHDLEGDSIIRQKLGSFYTVMENKFYVDEIYQKYILDPFVWAGENIVHRFDQKVIDGFINGLAAATSSIGDSLKKLQTGLVQNYMLIVVIGVVLIMSWLILG